MRRCRQETVITFHNIAAAMVANSASAITDAISAEPDNDVSGGPYADGEEQTGLHANETGDVWCHQASGNGSDGGDRKHHAVFDRR